MPPRRARGQPLHPIFGLGLFLRPATSGVADIEREIATLLHAGLALRFRVASHVDRGQTIEEPLASVLNLDQLTQAIVELLKAQR